MFNNCPVHFIFGFSFFISFGNEVTKISCHFQAKSVQLIFSFLVILTRIRKTKIVMNRTNVLVYIKFKFKKVRRNTRCSMTCGGWGKIKTKWGRKKGGGRGFTSIVIKLRNEYCWCRRKNPNWRWLPPVGTGSRLLFQGAGRLSSSISGTNWQYWTAMRPPKCQCNDRNLNPLCLS